MSRSLEEPASGACQLDTGSAREEKLCIRFEKILYNYCRWSAVSPSSCLLLVPRLSRGYEWELEEMGEMLPIYRLRWTLSSLTDVLSFFFPLSTSFPFSFSRSFYTTSTLLDFFFCFSSFRMLVSNYGTLACVLFLVLLYCIVTTIVSFELIFIL